MPCSSPRNTTSVSSGTRSAEYLTWKDCPQELPGILEWARRFNRVTRWIPRKSKARLSNTVLAEIRGETDVSYMLSVGSPLVDTEPVYANRTFSVRSFVRPRNEFVVECLGGKIVGRRGRTIFSFGFAGLTGGSAAIPAATAAPPRAPPPAPPCG